MVRLSTWMPFRPASRELAFFTGVQVAEATLGGEWKEVKTVALGVVNEPVEERGAQVVHSRELTYFSRTGGSGQFQQAALGEIHARGVEKAETVCAVSDGADWIPKFVDYHRQDAVRIQEAGSCHGVCGASGPSHPRAVALPRGTHHHAGALPPFKQARFQQWLKHQRHALKTGEASKVLAELSRFQTLMQERHVESAVETITKKLAYVHERQAMLTYATFQAQGYPIGSGSVESANKLVVQSRMKGAGMRWFPAHVNAMLALRNLACRPIGAILTKRSVVPDNY